MEMLYNKYSIDLKELLANKIKYKIIFNLINNDTYENIKVIVNDENIKLLIENNNTDSIQNIIKDIKIVNFIKMLINKKKYDKFIKITNDTNINNLIIQIVNERQKILDILEKKLNDLEWLNKRLVQFEKKEENTLNKARKSLETININIYDLGDDAINKQTDIKTLINELRKNPLRRFSLHLAKKYITIKCFLKDANIKNNNKN